MGTQTGVPRGRGAPFVMCDNTDRVCMLFAFVAWLLLAPIFFIRAGGRFGVYGQMSVVVITGAVLAAFIGNIVCPDGVEEDDQDEDENSDNETDMEVAAKRRRASEEAAVADKTLKFKFGTFGNVKRRQPHGAAQEQFAASRAARLKAREEA